MTDARWTAADVRAWVERHGGSVTACARRLGCGRTRLQDWMKVGGPRRVGPHVQEHMKTLDLHEPGPFS